ncbi:plasmid mobilization protein [Azospirillum sp.]|uniref:plasmid mobilization protein n=1 Tax=Azospirillum sp. TaxID=34012 RepID=UPI002D25E38A|nr:hypothetical protein [Azospirillum sp.]HYD70756.1 hypothetical protein [Azospirillum sp.]
MAARNGQELLSVWVPAELAAVFKAQARVTEGGTSAALRRLVCEAVRGCPPAAPRGAGAGAQVGVRFKEAERAALAEAARARGCSPANWLRSLALVHLARRPQWTPAEVEALRAVFRELRAIGHGVDRIARALEDAGGPAPPHADAVREAGAEVRAGMRRVVAVMTGNFDYWGLPDAERPTAAPGAAGRAGAEVLAAEVRRRNRPRRRAARFDAGE